MKKLLLAITVFFVSLFLVACESEKEEQYTNTPLYNQCQW